MENMLIIQFQNGEEKAFRQLYQLYSELALRHAFLMIREEEGVKDVVQETFIRIYRSLSRFDTNKPFKPWFYRILTNECYRYIEKKKKRRTEGEEPLQWLSDGERDRKQAEQKEEVTAALQRLSENHRAVLILKYLNGLTEVEIAQVLSIEQGAVKSRLYKARKKLQAVLRGDEM